MLTASVLARSFFNPNTTTCRFLMETAIAPFAESSQGELRPRFLNLKKHEVQPLEGPAWRSYGA